MDKQIGMTVDKATRLANKFLAEYNGNIGVQLIVVARQEDKYGPANTAERFGIIKGAYHPERRAFVLVASNLGDEEDARRTIRHELLGHYGLNTFKPAEKRALLDSVLETRQEPSLKNIWARVDRNYADRPELYKAEEVFAFVAEQERSPIGRAWDRVLNTLQKVLRRTGLSHAPLTQAELRDEARIIAQGIRNGTRQQQIFPKTDMDQFRIESDPASDKPQPSQQSFRPRRPAVDLER